MAIPTSYTEDELRSYMVAALGDVADVLTIGTADMVEPVNDVIDSYGVADIASATNITKLRALAKVGAWRKASQTATVQYTFRSGQSAFNRSDMYKFISDQLSRAESEAFQYDASYVVSVQPIEYKNDPYEPLEAGTAGTVTQNVFP